MTANFKKVEHENFNYSAFKMINKDWLQITVKANGRANSMTASWGGIGEMWGKYVAYIFIRPQRFTKTLIDVTDTLTLQVLPDSLRKVNGYLGRASGKDEDKIKNSGLTLIEDGKHVYFEESDIVIKAHKLFAQELTKESFIDKSNIDKWYLDNDFHTMYIVELDEILVKDSWLNEHPYVQA